MASLTNEEKAAILLLSLEEETASEVMKHLKPSEIRRLGKYMSRVSTISSETINSISREFCFLARERGRLISISEDVTKNIVIKAVGETEAESILSEVESIRTDDNPITDKLRDVDPKILMDFTKSEHPQTIALILAHLKPEKSAQILESFTPEMQFEITRRMATLKSVPQEYIDEVARTLEKEIVAGATTGADIGGIRMMADILNRMNRASENAILTALEDMDPELAAGIRNLMFTFDDVLQLDDRGLQEVLREISSEDIGKALKLVDEGMREKVYRNMSKRGAEMLKEELDLMPPIRISEAEESQRKIVEIAKKMEAEGRVVLKRGDEQDEYI
ncbi:flagellar motor switch protein FliG [Syntrophus aciditrophicus]|uniref:Flagellar motor switch protein FliG n=1 Tax=Syntrophus aciditrophicus (strain SB) TaxID=56780 RepID=Q2LRZ4_SYNAS|nr:flagellar motor switch protein FliG [Syntrophus aciditrophicus]ABC76852.1 flagellar motor switch protein [Syntrophus aciditrophicus SB]OPY17762.1 MAG: Flagellar motor switch protein FliG [Syntrophus sp. PtaB.Bin075]